MVLVLLTAVGRGKVVLRFRLDIVTSINIQEAYKVWAPANSCLCNVVEATTSLTLLPPTKLV